MGAGRQDALFARTKRVNEQVADLPAGLQRVVVAGELVVSEQADQVVFVRPDIPICARIQAEAFFRNISAEIAVWLLALDQLGRGVIQLSAQSRIAGVSPSQRGGVHPFADVLTNPGMGPRPMTKPGQQWFQIDLHEPVPFIVGHTRAQEAFERDG